MTDFSDPFPPGVPVALKDDLVLHKGQGPHDAMNISTLPSAHETHAVLGVGHEVTLAA